MNEVKQEQERTRIRVQSGSAMHHKEQRVPYFALYKSKTERERRTLASTFCKTLIWEITDDADGEERVKVKSALNAETPDCGDCSLA